MAAPRNLTKFALASADLMFSELVTKDVVSFEGFKKGMEKIAFRMNNAPVMQSGLTALLSNRKQAVIREVLPTPSAMSHEGMRLLSGSLTLYNRGLFEDALKALALARTAWERDALREMGKLGTDLYQAQHGESSPANKFGTRKSSMQHKTPLPSALDVYFLLMRSSVLMGLGLLDDAENAKHKVADIPSSHLYHLAYYHVEGLLQYYRGNYDVSREPAAWVPLATRRLPTSAPLHHRGLLPPEASSRRQRSKQFFQTVEELGSISGGLKEKNRDPMLEEAIVAALNNIALCQHEQGDKMQSLHTLRDVTRLNRQHHRSWAP
eukprot:gene1110-1664_t